MSLPKLTTTIYDLELPCSKKKIKFRPFLTSEHKAILFALQSEDKKLLFSNLIELIAKCVQEPIDAGALPLTDFLYLFVNIRARSVGDVIPLQFNYEVEGKRYITPIIKLNLIDIKPSFTDNHEKKKLIKLEGNVHLKMKYPPANIMFFLTTDEVDDIKILRECIECVTEGDVIHKFDDYSEDEVKTFIDSFSLENKQDIKDFIESIPKLEHTIKYKCEQTKTEHSFPIGGVGSFLG